MGSIRVVKEILKAKPVQEGAGVRLKRAFGFHQVPKLDPFLLFDDFHSDKPEDYLCGFPRHPHRGVETVSYILQGSVEHKDSLGNQGTIREGDVQWMTAGNGIVHQEMPKGDDKGCLWGFQLWVNLPASHKMMSPRYQEVGHQKIPETTLENQIKIKIISGTVNGFDGPVQDIVIDPLYIDVVVPEDQTFTHDIQSDYTVFAYILKGRGKFHLDDKNIYRPETVVIFDKGEQIQIKSVDDELRFLMVAGKPINEPIAWHGPIVMNTDEELETAFKEYLGGTFLEDQAEGLTY